jgi:protein gp37
MAQWTEIEWTDATWNPVTGCTKISPGCQNCYAERMAMRLKAMRQHRYRNGFAVTLHPDLLTQPLRWIKPRMIFVNSMSDLFHKNIPSKFIETVFEVMAKAHWHVFQILTKRAERLECLSSKIVWPNNVWIGVTIENQDCIRRIRYLKKVPAAVRFVSLEPLLGHIYQLPLDKIDWVIVGGESGPRARPLKPEWVRNIRDQCLDEGVPFFFKQWGGFKKSRNGRQLDGRIWDQLPMF